ncbi:MAG: hypothetical protein AAF558_06295 [Verrucomicrobiota bacterium]
MNIPPQYLPEPNGVTQWILGVPMVSNVILPIVVAIGIYKDVQKWVYLSARFLNSYHLFGSTGFLTTVGIQH